MLTRSCVQVCSHEESCSDQTWIIKLKIVALLQGPCDFETRASPDSPYVVVVRGRLAPHATCCVCCLSRFSIAVRRGVQSKGPGDAKGITARREQAVRLPPTLPPTVGLLFRDCGNLACIAEGLRV